MIAFFYKIIFMMPITINIMPFKNFNIFACPFQFYNTSNIILFPFIIKSIQIP